MKTFLIIASLFISGTATGQHYYNDILDARALGDRMKAYTGNKVKTVTATGHDPRGVKTTDFNEWQEVNTAAGVLMITTRNDRQVTRQYYRFDGRFRLIGLTDSSGDIKSTSVYTYDADDHIVSIKTITKDSLSDFSETEEHQWQYNAAGQPEKMWRIVNGRDSSEFRFTTDERGNVADEQLYRRGTGIEPVYYYYDAGNRLTDIVRYNKKAKRLLPDLMFEYDENDRVIQKITTLSANNPDYLIWRYLYNDKGLKTREALFNKHKELRGRIEYSFTF